MKAENGIQTGMSVDRGKGAGNMVCGQGAGSGCWGCVQYMTEWEISEPGNTGRRSQLVKVPRALPLPLRSLPHRQKADGIYSQIISVHFIFSQPTSCYHRNNLGWWMELLQPVWGSKFHRWSFLVVQPTFCVQWLISDPVWPVSALSKGKSTIFTQVIVIIQVYILLSLFLPCIFYHPDKPKCSTFLEISSCT